MKMKGIVVGYKDIRYTLTQFALNAEKASVRTMNDVSKNARTASFKAIREDYNIKLKDLRPHTTLSRAKLGKAQVEFAIKSHGIPLIQFATRRFVSLSREEQATKKGVSYKVSKRKRASTLAHSFINRSRKKGKDYVLTRTSKPRYPLIPLTVITPTSMLEKSKADDAFAETFVAKFDARFKHHMDRLI